MPQDLPALEGAGSQLAQTPHCVVRTRLERTSTQPGAEKVLRTGFSEGRRLHGTGPHLRCLLGPECLKSLVTPARSPTEAWGRAGFL